MGKVQAQVGMTKQIGKYEIIRTLGQGAMGEVYLAHHPAIGREVAIKTILPSAAKGEDAEGRFRREAEAAGKLNHPNLVTIYDFDKDPAGGVLFLVMEFVKGDDLEDLLARKALSPSELLDVLAQVCDGLSHAHRNGIIHRDIKPSNVRVVRDGKQLLAKVMDFGIARIADSNMTATGIVMGTVSYMAPEYIREGRATAQSDLFAVGVMLYEGLTGRKPFAGDNTTTILFKIVSDPPPPIDMDTIHGISPSVRMILDKVLAKEPQERFQSADDLGRALRACKDPTWTGTLDDTTSMLLRHQQKEALQGTRLIPAAAAGAPTWSSRPAAPAPGPAPRRRAGLVAAGAAAVLVAGGAGFLAIRPRTRVAQAAPAPAAMVPAAPPVAAVPSPAPAPVPVASPAPVPVPNPSAAAAKPPAAAAAKPPAAAAASAAPAAKAPAAPIPAQAAVKPQEAPKAQPAEPAKDPNAVDPAAADPMKTIGKLIDTDPRQAVAVLKPLVQAQPGNTERQGNYLAALYRCRNAPEFDRAFTRATAAGVTVKGMLGVSSFHSALADEIKLQKSKPPSGVLPVEVMARVAEGL